MGNWMNLAFSFQEIFFFLSGCVAGILIAGLFFSMRMRLDNHHNKSALERLSHALAVTEAGLREKSHDYQVLSAQWDSARNDEVALREQNSGLQIQVKQISALKDDLSHCMKMLGECRDQLSLSQQARTEALTRLDVQQQEFIKKEQVLLESRQLYEKEFQLVANRLFEEKSERFTQQNRLQVGEILMPLRDQLQDFRRKIEDVYDKEAKDRTALHREISLLRDLNVRISQEAENLTQALKGDNKAQGNWGELVLERVLALSGLVKGREFDVQPSYRAEDGQWLRPDVVVHLPDGKDVVVDSKVSLLQWDAYCSAPTEGEAIEALRGHVQSLKNHIRNLSGKQYSAIPGIRSLDFVLLFIPIEAAFLKLMEVEPEMFSEAYAKGLMLVCPSTLLVTLRTIQNLWRYEYQNRNALRIAECAGGLHDQFVLVIEAVREVGERLGKATQSYDSLCKRMIDGKGNVMRRVSELEMLGAKTRRKLVFEDSDVQPSESVFASVDSAADLTL